MPHQMQEQQVEHGCEAPPSSFLAPALIDWAMETYHAVTGGMKQVLHMSYKGGSLYFVLV